MNEQTGDVKEQTTGKLSPDEMRAAPKTGRDDLEPTEMTTWDGEGNPIRSVFTDNAEGRLAEGTGRNTEDALKDAQADGKVLGEDSGPSEGG